MGGILGSPKIPTPAPPPVMPVPDESALAKDKAKKNQMRMLRSGRQSTDLTGGSTATTNTSGSNTLGGN